jgi:hypothetical protein
MKIIVKMQKNIAMIMLDTKNDLRLKDVLTGKTIRKWKKRWSKERKTDWLF